MAEYYSHEPYLRAISEYLNMENILEWGPGKSTEFLSETLPNSSILSIEHNFEYYLKAKENLKGRTNVELVYVKHTMAPSEAEGYITYPLRRLIPTAEIDVYDFIFIDGRSRADCITLSYLLLKKTGVVMVHDSERPNYQKALNIFPYLFGKNFEPIGVSVATKDGIIANILGEIMK